MARSGSELMRLSEALDISNAYTCMYIPITPLIRGLKTIAIRCCYWIFLAMTTPQRIWNCFRMGSRGRWTEPNDCGCLISGTARLIRRQAWWPSRFGAGDRGGDFGRRDRARHCSSDQGIRSVQPNFGGGDHGGRIGVAANRSRAA